MIAIEESVLRDDMLIGSTAFEKRPMELVASRLLPSSQEGDVGEREELCGIGYKLSETLIQPYGAKALRLKCLSRAN